MKLKKGKFILTTGLLVSSLSLTSPLHILAFTQPRNSILLKL
ncbi:hypothetical protein [Velocimicrobium porci]|nr:hypothetical protein [Velocimicrobium porci]